MRHWTQILISLTFLMACSPGRQTRKPQEPQPFNISNLPKDWVRLTKTDSGFIIFNSCDAGNLLLKVSSDSRMLLLSGTQEDYELEIVNPVLMCDDTVLIHTRFMDSGEQASFRFVWTNKKEKLARWITTYSTGLTSDFEFVAAEGQEKYPRVDQPCRECWGDECDE